MLVSDLQNQFPNDAIEVMENDNAGLVAKVVDMIERPDQASDRFFRANCAITADVDLETCLPCSAISSA